jgi:phospho-N-acetylmuramoyl-pentapeptide-transferase
VLGLVAAGSVAFVLGLIGTFWLIRLLRARGIGQPIHEAVTQHAAKAGTPTMGGLMLSAVAPIGYGAGLLALGRGPGRPAVTLLVCIIGGGVVGAIDDWFKVRRGRNTLGLRERQKTMLLLGVAAVVVVASIGGTDVCHAPSIGRCGPLPDLGPGLWPVWVVAVVWLTANSVNFADGLDGLLAGSSIAPLSLLTVIAYWQYRHPDIYGTRGALDVALVLAAMTACCVALLWWSAAPAQVFMGETGSLAIGSAIAVAALQLNVELLIPVFGVLYVVVGFSSFAQRTWFKLTRALRADHQPQRLFRMAPLHHHFEMLGWNETKIVVRFWIISALGSALAGAIYYADALRALRR